MLLGHAHAMHFVSISTEVRPLRSRLGGFSCVWIAYGQWTRATLRRTQTRRSSAHRIAIGARAAMVSTPPISRLKSRVLQPQRSAEALRWAYVQRTQFVHRCAHEASVVSRCSLRAGCSCMLCVGDEGAQAAFLVSKSLGNHRRALEMKRVQRTLTALAGSQACEECMKPQPSSRRLRQLLDETVDQLVKDQTRSNIAISRKV